MLRLSSTVAAAFFVACHAQAALADTTYGDGITAEMRKQDPRLDARVTLYEPRISAGELLEKLGARVNVPITAGDRDGAGDVEVFVRVNEMPAAELMDCLWSLVSYKGAQWTWRRDGQNGDFAYTLERPLRARGIAEQLRAQMQAALESEVEAKIQLALMTPDERKRHIRQFVRNFFDGDDKLAQAYLEPYSDRQWSGLATMAEMLSPDERRGILRGGGIRVPVEKLSPAGRAYVHKVWVDAHASTTRPDGTQEPVPEPTWISFTTQRHRSTKTVPMLMIYMEGLGGYAYAGGRPAEEAARKRLRKLWMHEGDQLDSPLEKGRFSKPKEPRQREPGDTQTELVLKQLCDCASFPILARLPPQGHGVQGLGYTEPYGMDRAEWLNGDFDAFFQWKWRKGSLLAANHGWFLDEEQVVPWKVLFNLRKERDAGTGKLPLESICAAAARLEWDQMLGLRSRFPVIYEAASFHDMLAALHAKPLLLKRLREPRGIPLKEALPLIRMVNDWRLDDILAPGTVEAVRIIGSLPGSATKWDVELLDRDGKVVSSRGFIDIGYPTDEMQARQKKAGGP